MNEERIDVADSKIPRRHALPACAAVRAHAESGGDFWATISCRRRAVNLAGVIRRNQPPVRIGVYAVDRRPSFAPIRAPEKTTDFDRDVNDVRIIRVKGDALRMRLMGRAGGGATFKASQLAYAWR